MIFDIDMMNQSINSSVCNHSHSSFTILISKSMVILKKRLHRNRNLWKRNLEKYLAHALKLKRTYVRALR